MKCLFIIYFLALLFGSVQVFSTDAELIWMKQGEDASSSCFQFSRDGKYFFVQNKLKSAGKYSYTIQKWNIENKKVEKEYKCNNDLSQMILSNDDSFLLCAYKGAQYIDLINLITGEAKTISDISISGYPSAIASLALSKDGKNIYVYHNSVKQIQIIDFNTLKKVDSLVLINKTSMVRFSFDGQYAGTLNGDSSLSIRNMTDKTEMYKVKVPVGNFSVSNVFVNSDNFIINYSSTVKQENIEVYSMKTGNLISKTKSAIAFPISFMLIDFKTILTSSYQYNYVEKLDLTTNITSKTNMNANSRQMIISSDGKYLASVDSAGNPLIYDITSESPVLTINKTTQNLIKCSKILISPDNKSVYVAGIKSADTSKKGQVIEYDFVNGNVKNVFPISNTYITDMVLSKDGKIIGTVDTTGKIVIISNIHDSGMNQKVYDLKKSISSIAISDDNTKFLACGYMTGFYYIDMKSDSIHFDFQDPYSILDLDPNLKTLALNSKGDKLILAGKKKSIFVFKFNTDSAKFLKTYDFTGDESTNSQSEGITQIAFSNDNKFIYSSASDGYTHIFNSETYTEVGKIGINPDSLKYYPSTSALTKDNSMLVAGDIYPGIGIYDVKSGDKLWSQKFEDFKNYRINSITLSDDNGYLAFGSSDGSFGVYKIHTNTSVNDQSYNTLINISPNPARDYIDISSLNPTLKYGVDEGSEIQIFNLMGIPVSEIYKINGSFRINIENLSSGIYFIKIGNKLEKFVKM